MSPDRCPGCHSKLTSAHHDVCKQVWESTISALRVIVADMCLRGNVSSDNPEDTSCADVYHPNEASAQAC
jgi:hypothetical protein